MIIKMPSIQVHEESGHADHIASEQQFDSAEQPCNIPDSQQYHSTFREYSPLPPLYLSVGDCKRYELSSSMPISPPAKPGISGKAPQKARSYTREELLSMRKTLPAVASNAKKLNPKFTSDSDKVPEDLCIDIKHNGRANRDMGSTARKSVSRSSHTSGISGDARQSHLETTDGPRSPEDQEEVILFRGNLALQSHEQKQMWMLRKRGSSDRSSQPMCAPSGIEGQNAENFRKFYAAVISPTHLRVTAGGRIVPNTRGLPHSSFMWNAEKRCFESTDGISGPEIGQKSYLPSAKTEDANPDSPSGITRPTVEEFFGPPLHPNSSAQSAAPTKHDEVRFSSATADVAVEEIGVEEVVAAIGEDHTGIQGHIKISPPSQFDVLRPFYMNGQPFYPAPSGIQIPVTHPTVPFNMLASHNTAYQTILPQYGPTQLAPWGFPVANFGYSPPLTLDGQQVHQQIPTLHSSEMHPSLMIPQLHNPLGQHFGMAPIMPTASLREEPRIMHPHVSLVINQIQALQYQSRHLENQLQNNKHQIDEQHVLKQQNHVQNQISALLAGLNTPVLQSGSLLKDQYGATVRDTGARVIGVPLAPVTNSGAVSRGNAIDITSISQNSFQTSVKNKTVLEKKDFDSGTPSSQADDSQGGTSVVSTKPTISKRLSASAAMAPEFQPRARLAHTHESSPTEVELPAILKSGDSAVITESDFSKRADASPSINVTSWSTAGQWAEFSQMHDHITKSNGFTKHHPMQGNHFTRSSGHFQVQGLPSNSTVTNRAVAKINDDADPYLMGYPPPGMPINRVKSVDMMYSRALTKEELQARQVYWGKAPLALAKGLPKFDGKDFYAPSPDKASISPKVHSSYKQNQVGQRSDSSSTTSLEPNSTQSAHKIKLPPSRDGCKDYQNLSGSTDTTNQPIYKALGDNARSSVKLVNDADSLDAWGLAKADEEEMFERPAHLTSGFDGKKAVLGDGDSVKLERSGSSSKFVQPSLLQDMLKHSPCTATAAPTGGLSSTVAHGYLNRWGGVAATSLAPSRNIASPSPASFKKGRVGSLGHQFPGRGENLPLPRKFRGQNNESAAELLKKFRERKEDKVESRFKPNSKGLGPIFGGADW